MDDLLESILYRAIESHATDIHLNLKKELKIKMRILGQMTSFDTISDDQGKRLMNYIKYKACININYQLLPQTGAFSLMINQHRYDLRVSYLPGLDFESIVIRILNNHDPLTLNELTQLDDYKLFLNSIIHRTSGLFLISGATGSGKSTTLYTMIDAIIKQGGRHIVTLEDPIEMRKEECLQIEIDDTIGINYHDSLRQILRHDPDVIMIGEIRDEQTAALAITCALTGHLVLSTVHSANALLVIRRLQNLGLSISDLEEVLIGIVSQKIKYDLISQKVVILPEYMNQMEIINYLHHQTTQYHTFKQNAIILIKEHHHNRRLFEEELL